MRVIKLGADSQRLVPGASALGRPVSRPPPLPDLSAVLPAFEEPRTEPRNEAPPLPAPYADVEDEIAEVESSDVEEAPRVVRPPPKRARPLPPSLRPRPASEAGLDIEITVQEEDSEQPLVDGTETPTPAIAAVAALQAAPDGFAAQEVSEAEAEPTSDEEAVSVEDTEPVLAEIASPPPAPAPSSDDLSREGVPAKKPPPPPKRAKTPSAPAEQVEPPRVELAPQRPKRWWEELFSEDFARGIFPLTEPQIKREVDFIEESLGVAKGGIVLDLACGTGHHAVELSSRGYGVVGFDLSLPQLALAGEYAQERRQKINFLQGDMREMSFDSVFDGVYCWDTSFGYFEEDKNIAVAERVFRSLRPGGNFLLDVINRDFVVEQQPSQVWFEGDACVCMDDMSVDFITSRLRVKRTMMLDDGRTRELAYSVRVYSLHELGKILHGIGFRVLEASGHLAYPGIFLGATSPRVMILAQKP